MVSSFVAWCLNHYTKLVFSLSELLRKKGKGRALRGSRFYRQYAGETLLSEPHPISGTASNRAALEISVESETLAHMCVTPRVMGKS